MLWLYRFIFGYLTLEFSGDIVESMLNLCARNGISIWNAKRIKGKIRCCMTIREYRLLPSVARGSGIRMHIRRKYGLPFIAARYKKRIGLFVGAAVFFLFLQVMSCFIWTVEVTGNVSVPTEEIIAACEEIGICEGVPKKSINPQNHKQRLLLKLDKLAWASLNIEGSRLTVNVTEVKKKESNSTEPTNLKARADGVIKKIDITSGNCVVKVGQLVHKGDLLVSGVVETADTTRFVRSQGSVIAETEREITVSAGWEKTVKEKTGNKRKKSVLSFFGMTLPLYLGSEHQNYESRLEVSEAKLFGKSLPLRIYTREFEYYKENKVTLNREQLEKELEYLLEKEIEKEKIENYEIKNSEITETESGLMLKVIVSAEEDITFQDILIFSTGN